MTLLFGLAFCTQKKENSHELAKKTNSEIVSNLDVNHQEIKKEAEDSLRNPLSSFYLTDLKLEEVGKLILNDSIKPSDNLVTFCILDSISSTNKATRDFFFPVYKKIVKQSDGALADMVAGKTKQYIEKYPNEFAERYACCGYLHKCCEDIIELTSLVGYEIMVSPNSKEEYQNFKESIVKNYPNYKKHQTLKIFIINLDNHIANWKD